MMFIVRGALPSGPDVTVKLTRRTPNGDPASLDHFCIGDPDAVRRAGAEVVALHDGWYADDTGGGVAIWGQGLYWEIRDTPFTVRETDTGRPDAAGPVDTEVVNVRGAIFGT